MNQFDMFSLMSTEDRDKVTPLESHDWKWSFKDYPEDYRFSSEALIEYVCGMSVPPVMIKRIVEKLIDQGVFDYKEVAYDNKTKSARTVCGHEVNRKSL